MKATHDGHCQLCGRRQRLPGGRLAKHGYDTRFGFFNGVCPGSGYLPIEVATDRIQAAIDAAYHRQAKLLAEAVQARGMTEYVWVHEYVPASYHRRSGYVWAKHTVSQIEVGNGFVKAPATLGKLNETRRYDTYTFGPPVPLLNERYAVAQEKRAAQEHEYARWLESRIRDWQPMPLIPRTLALKQGA